jgi:CRISPR-associated protein Csd1
MLLKELAAYFDRLENTAPPMYQKTRIRWLVDLDSTGKLQGFVTTSSGQSKGKDRGKEFFAPHVGRSSGAFAKLLTDNGEYVLGIARPKSKPARVAQCHQLFVQQVAQCAEATGEPSVTAVSRFLDEWRAEAGGVPADFDPADVLTFRVEGRLPMDLSSVRAYWAARAKPSSTEGENAQASGAMQCLVCGELRPPVKRLPFKIKGIPDGQMSGNALISANSPAFESYGLEASLIAPTCQECGEHFSKAANALLEDASTRLRIPPLVYIFWTREDVAFNPARLLSDPQPEEVKALLESAWTGNRAAAQVTDSLFYAAAFSASGARVAVRDWIDTTVRRAATSLARYFALQRLVDWDGASGKPLGLYALAASTVRDAKSLAPYVPQDLLHIALKGGPLPMDLLFQAARRNHADQAVTRPRAALIKMVLLSQHPGFSREDSMERLDPSNQNPAYLCGRLMGVLESVQRAALGDVGANVTARYFGTASSAPASVFGTLLRGAQHHLDRLRKERRGTYEALQRRLEEVTEGLPLFPKVLTLEEQGLFSLGYYHQRAGDRAAAIARKAQREGQAPDPSSKGEPNDER